MGFNPEALCGEAPKGQPEIRRGNIQAVCVEAPKGQPRNHRPRTRKPHNKRPTGEEFGRHKTEKEDPPSSRSTMKGVKENGGRSPETLPGGLAASTRTWMGK